MFYSNDGGFRVDCPNGWTVSVQWAGSNYGDNSSMSRFSPPVGGWKSKTAEVAAWRTKARDSEAWYDSNPLGLRGRSVSTGVRGWQTVGEVMEYIRMISDLEDKPQPKVKDSIFMESKEGNKV
jgi:hypothetical protein